MSSGTPYAPARWIPGAHAMTVFASLARPFPRPRARRERWELPDGDFLDVDRFDALAAPVRARAAQEAPRTESRPVLVVCHGLEGSSRAPYVRGLVALALSRGLAALAINFRGCSGEPNRLARNYHSGETGDVAHVVERLVAERPGRPLLLAGFSLGGNVVAKLLGERGDALPPEVRGGAVISVPFDLERSARAMDAPGFWNFVYRERFMRRLRAKAAEKARRFPGAFDAAAAARASTFAQFDGAVTAPVFGFASAEDYWRRCSSGPFLAGVRRPLLALSSLDDPIVPADTVPVAIARANPAVTLETTAAGGHVAFVAGLPFWPTYWAERRAVEFLAELVPLPSPAPPGVGDPGTSPLPSPAPPGVGDPGTSPLPSPAPPGVGDPGTSPLPSPAPPGVGDPGTSPLPSPAPPGVGDPGTRAPR